MNKLQIIQTVALVIIALELAAPSLQKLTSAADPKTKFVKVLGKASDFGPYGPGTQGLFIEDAGAVRLIPFDTNSLFDRMPAPAALKIIEWQHGSVRNVSYVPFDVVKN